MNYDRFELDVLTALRPDKPKTLRQIAEEVEAAWKERGEKKWIFFPRKVDYYQLHWMLDDLKKRFLIDSFPLEPAGNRSGFFDWRDHINHQLTDRGVREKAQRLAAAHQAEKRDFPVRIA
ncbi:MAG TPA: hypothetical protein VG753_01765 [Candidatus Paceibacterota bacterium]|nr:hypothetical protein [Candidatus Paceibacterota bacterium]